MLEVLSIFFGAMTILFFLIPIAVFIYVLFFFKTDLDHDGKEDNKWIWQK